MWFHAQLHQRPRNESSRNLVHLKFNSVDSWNRGFAFEGKRGTNLLYSIANSTYYKVLQKSEERTTFFDVWRLRSISNCCNLILIKRDYLRMQGSEPQVHWKFLALIFTLNFPVEEEVVWKQAPNRVNGRYFLSRIGERNLKEGIGQIYLWKNRTVTKICEHFFDTRSGKWSHFQRLNTRNTVIAANPELTVRIANCNDRNSPGTSLNWRKNSFNYKLQNFSKTFTYSKS